MNEKYFVNSSRIFALKTKKHLGGAYKRYADNFILSFSYKVLTFYAL